MRSTRPSASSATADCVLRIVVLGARSELLRCARLFVPSLDLPYEVSRGSTDDRKIEVEEGLTVDTTIGPMDRRRHLDERRGDPRERRLSVKQVPNQRRPLTIVDPGDPVDDLSVKTESLLCHAATMPEVAEEPWTSLMSARSWRRTKSDIRAPQAGVHGGAEDPARMLTCGMNPKVRDGFEFLGTPGQTGADE